MNKSKCFPLVMVVLLSIQVIQAGVFDRKPAAVPRPEHPRPDLQRDNWMSLNGECFSR